MPSPRQLETAVTPAKPYYWREITTPKTDREGLCNAVQMVINHLERGDVREALLQAVDIVDGLSGSVCWRGLDRPAGAAADPSPEVTAALARQRIQLATAHAIELEAAVNAARQDGIQIARVDVLKRLGFMPTDSLR